MPELLATAAPEEPEPARGAPEKGALGWVCPDHLDHEAVSRLRSLTIQMPQPWVLDWVDLSSIDAQACGELAEAFVGWCGQKIEMQWMGGERLFKVLTDVCVVGDRDVDPIFWKLRSEALRLVNRPEEFDEVAIDFCVTYEVSPPSWVAPKCDVKISGSEHNTGDHPLSLVGDVSTSFVESQLSEFNELVEMATVQLSGQLMGDITDVLQSLDASVKSAPIISVCCNKLIRVDFIAAGDLLNWVLNKRSDNRSVIFTDTHRLVALFFSAMGIHEHATVKIRNV
jgi:hypothetical protein